MVAEPAPAGRMSTWSRSYPPLLLAVLAMLIAGLVLPSALNLPQSNPSTVLEYAPVPPEDDNPPPPAEGNVSSLGLGRSSSLTEGGQPPPPPPPPPPPDQGSGSRPEAKRCVAGKQTEDPMAPPCVPFFDGDNFGATYQGVTGDEIRVLIYLDNGCPNFECAKAPGEYEDLSSTPPKPRCPKTWPSNNPGRNECDYPWIRTTRAFSKYFNDRFQTYEREVRFWAFVTAGGSEQERRKDAAANWTKLKPFAVIDFATYFGNNAAYDNSMAARGVTVFTQQAALPNQFFRQSAPRAWGFWPDVEHWAQQYITYVCQKVAPHPVRRYGNPPGQGAPNGEPRKFGLFYTEDPDEHGLRLFAELVKAGLRDCGVTWEAEGTFKSSGFTVDAGDDGRSQTEAVARFQNAGVTTVLYLGGIEGRFSQAADGVKYYPEIVLAGDIENDNNVTGRRQNQNVWQNVWGTHFHLRLDRPEDTPGWQAYKEAVPGADPEDAPFANEAYRDHFMLFQAIQVAGPRLTPEKISEGFHAIPPHSSTDPYIASCFFDPGDYTCVKDAAEIWWDPAGRSPASPEPGCYRMVRGGKRYLAGDWEGGDDAFVDPADPCTGFERRIQIDPG